MRGGWGMGIELSAKRWDWGAWSVGGGEEWQLRDRGEGNMGMSGRSGAVPGLKQGVEGSRREQKRGISVAEPVQRSLFPTVWFNPA